MSVSVLRNSPNSEPRSILAGVLAVLVHLVFVALLIFGLNWKDHPPEGMVVDIWTELPKPVQEPVKMQPPPKQSKPVQEPVKPKPAPEPEPEPRKPEPPKPEPPKPEPVKPEPAKPVPQKAAVIPPVKKPDIAMQQKPEPIKEIKPDLEEQKKKEQERLKELEKQKELEKKKELEKQKELDKQKEIAKQKELERQKESERQKELEKQKELQKQKEKELAAQRQREQEAKAQAQAQAQAQREAEAQRAAQQAAARNQVTNEISKYKAMILAKIRSRIVMPPDLAGNPIAEFSVTLLPGGDILDVRLSKSSGHASFDNAVERAIFLSKPLPLPPDPALFSEFRNLNITVHYRE